MLNEPTVLAVTLTPMQEALQGHGVDFAALARQAGIDLALLSQPNARYPSARIQRLWRLAAAASGDPVFGLRVGSLSRPGVLHALGLGILSSTSVLAALKRVERYGRLVSTNGRFVLVQDGTEARLVAHTADLAVTPTAHSVDALAVTVCRTLTQCGGAAALPLEVRLPHPAAAATEVYAAVFGCPVKFESADIEIVFDADSVSGTVFSGNQELAEEADRLSARYIETLAPDTASARVRALLLKAMPSGEVNQDGVARALNQSASTLQRRLRDEGTSFQQLMDATRRDLALGYLRDRRHSLADIAFLLGFSDQSNFTRAFRRWTGKTPREYLS